MALLVLVAVGRINSHVCNGKTIAAVDTNDLDGRVLDGNAGDGGVGQFVSGEELGLGLSTISTLTVPPTSTITVENRSLGALDSDLLSLDVKKGTLPFRVAPGGGTLEDDSSTVSQTREVQSCA